MKKIVFIALLGASIMACGPGQRTTESTDLDKVTEETSKEAEKEAARKAKAAEKQAKADAEAMEKRYKEATKVKISTVHGDMICMLYDETPLHKENFLKLTKEGFYNDLLFHRVINRFMIQGGDPTSRGAAKGVQLGSGGPGYTIPAEINPKFFHKKGALSAARQGDQVNPERKSSGSQFYVVQGQAWPEAQIPGNVQGAAREVYKTLGGTPHLDGQYTVFGEVIEGLEVIDKIAAVKTVPGDRPAEDVKMTVTVVK